MKTCYLIRHAKSAPDPAVPEPLWPLSPEGRIQATQLGENLKHAGITRILSSPYRRAIDTVQPLADALGLEVELHDDLRERQLTGVLIDNWMEELEKTWQDFDYCLPQGESSAACQARITTCFSNIFNSASAETVAISSHGNAIALMMNAIDPGFGFLQWKEMGNPHIFRLIWNGQKPRWDKEFKLPSF